MKDLVDVPVGIVIDTPPCFSFDVDLTVLTTGDTNGQILRRPGELVENYFYTQMVLPMSTFALAIGKWKVVEIITTKTERYKLRMGSFKRGLTTKLTAPGASFTKLTCVFDKSFGIFLLK
jgi:hypothetical protein